MSVRVIPLFDRGYPTIFLIRQWTQRGALQPLRLLVCLEADLSATPVFRSLWQAAFPERGPLPYGPLADKAGRGTDAFWNVFG